MKQILLSLFLIYSLCACNNSTRVKSASEIMDSIEIDRKADSMVSETMKQITQNVWFDTIGIDQSGVIITSAKLVKREYSNYKDVYLTYKNVGTKNISAIRFHWFGENAFGEPADMGGSEDGFGGGFDDSGLRAGKATSGEWSVLSRDGKKIVKAWPYEIAYEDGTKWKSSSK